LQHLNYGLPWSIRAKRALSIYGLLLAPNHFFLLSRRLKISKWDIFHYVYGALHHPGYRGKFADNLKRELSRIRFAPVRKNAPLRPGQEHSSHRLP
jgi:hypothetical protein